MKRFACLAVAIPFLLGACTMGSGLLLQANWGGSAFLPYEQLNQP